MSSASRSSGLPPASRFILDAVGMEFGGRTAALPSQLDWSTVPAAVQYHRVPLLMTAALDVDGLVPEPVRQQLLEMRKSAAVRMLRLSMAATQAVAALRQAGIHCLLLKGPAHSVLFHGRPDRRWFRDIDLLVQPGERLPALKVLDNLGYVIIQPDLINNRSVSEISLARADDGALIELHTGLDIAESLFPLARLQPFADTRTIMIGGQPVEVMNAEKSLVYAAFHGAKHLWHQYFWLCDIAAAQRSGRVDWQAAMAIARHVGSERHLLMAGLLVEKHMGIAFPTFATGSSAPHSLCRRLADELSPVLADTNFSDHGMQFRGIRRMKFLLWDLRLQRRWTARLATLVAHWRPTPTDREYLRLPGWLGFLYPAVRLIRVLRQRDGT